MKLKGIHIVLLVLLIFSFTSFQSQTFPLSSPNFGPAFLQDEVAVVEIILDQADWDFILHPDNEASNIEHPATFIYITDAGWEEII
jgi:hypothetical protein